MMKKLIASSFAFAFLFISNISLTVAGNSSLAEDELHHLTELASSGDVIVQINLASIFYYGSLGVPQDYREAAKWYRKAAEHGYVGGQYTLGFMYEYGKGVLQDYKEALKWYRQAAEQGNTGAQHNLAVMYEHG
ncbi:MAG: sel1 repeat family protein, partial [Desulfobulbaceae bacterium]|nr:sel1 repeat family protein [Desulfobulbaceae bacterium]